MYNLFINFKKAMKNSVGCIIQARSDSKRLPGKVLYKIKNTTILEILINRLKKLGIKKLIVATTKKKSDNEIVKIAEKNKIFVFRGDELNVLKRYYKCAKRNQLKTIIRITSDCPLIDVKYVRQLLNFFKKNNYDYVSNINNYLPDGMSCEIFSFESLKKSFFNAKKKFDKEHVTPFIWKNPQIFNIYNIGSKKRLKIRTRLTLDYIEDFYLIEVIVKNLYSQDKHFSLNKIENFLLKNRKYLRLNKKYLNLQKKMYHEKRSNFLK